MDTTLEIQDANPLPITVVDEDIYQTPPNLLIGTVDKFAMLAWKPEIRSVFGIGAEGNHTGHPPTLIIQDELHLISGPLGSMVGAYETVIEELCTERQAKQLLRPKIVASTATISKSSEQIKALYGRPDTMLFPPPGLDAGSSFFSHEALDADGAPRTGTPVYRHSGTWARFTADDTGPGFRRSPPISPGHARQG